MNYNYLGQNELITKYIVFVRISVTTRLLNNLYSKVEIRALMKVETNKYIELSEQLLFQ